MQMHHVNEIEIRQQAIAMVKGAGYNPVWICETYTLDVFLISDKADQWLYVDTISGEIREATQQEYDKFCLDV